MTTAEIAAVILSQLMTAAAAFALGRSRVPRGTNMAHSPVPSPIYDFTGDCEGECCSTSANGPSRALHSDPEPATRMQGRRPMTDKAEAGLGEAHGHPGEVCRVGEFSGYPASCVVAAGRVPTASTSNSAANSGRVASGRPPWPQLAREWLRYKIGWALAEPFWRVHLVGDRALDVSTRLIRWGEKASR